MIPEAVPLAVAVGGALSMMVYTGTRSMFTTGVVRLNKEDRENLFTTEEYNVSSPWGLKSNDQSLLRKAGAWWGSSNVLPNQFVEKTFFTKKDE